jgi:hypothetical protein
MRQDRETQSMSGLTTCTVNGGKSRFSRTDPSLLEYIPSLPSLPAHFILFLSLSFFLLLLSSLYLLLIRHRQQLSTHYCLSKLTMYTLPPIGSKLVKRPVKRPASNLPAVDLSSDDSEIPAPSVKKSRGAPTTRSGSLAVSCKLTEAEAKAETDRQKTKSVSSIQSVEVPYR